MRRNHIPSCMRRPTPAASSSGSEAPVVRERLYRSRSDRMLFGVAGGMADWLDLDPSLVRIVWAILVLAGGVGLLLYIVAAIVIPEEPIGGAAHVAGGAGDAAAGSAAGAGGPAMSSSG